MAVKKTRIISGLESAFTAAKRDSKFWTRFVKVVPFVNRRYTKGGLFLSKMVYKRVRGWTFVSSPKNVTIKISRLLSCRGPKKFTRRCWGTQRIFFWKWAVNYRKRKFRRFEGIFKRFSVLLERIYLFLTPSGLNGYSPSQQSGLFHVYQPAEKKNISIQISAAGLLGNCGADSSIYGKN